MAMLEHRGMVNGRTKPLRVAVFNASERYHGYATGVGKHAVNMVGELARRKDVDLTFWVPKDYWALDQSAPSMAPLAHVQSCRLPISRRAYAAATLSLNWPSLDLYSGEVDWIYSPREVLVSARHANTAVTIHDVYHFEPGRKKRFDPRTLMRFAMWSRIVSRASVVLTVSEFSKSRICEVFGADRARVQVLGNGIEQHFFDISRMDPDVASPLSGVKYFIAVGGISRKKGGHNLLRFAEQLAIQASEIRLVVIGPVEQEFRSDASAARNVMLIDGGIDDLSMGRWIRGAIALVSLSNYEGFGIPGLEAMAAGVPVVANRGGGALPEIIGEAGLMIDADSATDLAEAVELRRDANLRDTLIKRGHARAAEYRWDRFCDRLATLLSAYAARPYS
ncbi:MULTISPECIES: glycosyltransferase family 1 protein [unclassified Methylosinus]|uniref:glycosyltransferase family 4 protein n=1 Tax=unclassified Methylosinus TaxID=2624500 RepID=UPI0004677571|nr:MULTISPECIES: glycosyltransferase family 1 protein [unclassified Methylosinus]